MFAVLVNSITIILGCILGLLIKGGIPKRISDTIMHSIALCIIYIGISGSLEGKNTLVTIISMAVGGLIGEIINVDNGLNKLGDFVDKLVSKNNKSKENKNIAQAFVSSSLLFCIGAMAVVGSLEAGLQGEYKTLFAKSILDGITSIIFTATLGIGVVFSAISVFFYQGIIVICASALASVLSTSVISSMTGVGSLLILGLGLNILGVTKIKIANLLPCIFIPIVFGIIGIV